MPGSPPRMTSPWPDTALVSMGSGRWSALLLVLCAGMTPGSSEYSPPPEPSTFGPPKKNCTGEDLAARISRTEEVVAKIIKLNKEYLAEIAGNYNAQTRVPDRNSQRCKTMNEYTETFIEECKACGNMDVLVAKATKMTEDYKDRDLIYRTIYLQMACWPFFPLDMPRISVFGPITLWQLATRLRKWQDQEDLRKRLQGTEF